MIVIEADFLIYGYISGFNKWFSIICVLFGIALIALCVHALWKLENDPVFGDLFIDTEKIIFRNKKGREIEFKYDECKDLGVYGYLYRGSEQKFIYFSKLQLSDDQKDYLYYGQSQWKEKKKIKLDWMRDSSSFAIISYQKDVFDQIIKCAPEWAKQRLIEDKDKVLSMLIKEKTWEENFWSRDGRAEIKQKSMKRDESKHSDGDFSEKK